jgi:putative membrane-bound dehydrogenase-like protein
MKHKSLLIAAVYITLVVQCTMQDNREKTENSTATPYADLTEDEKHLAQNALLSFETAEGLEVGLFASEPMITNPTNMDIDARGRVWICEVQNYRLPYNPTYEARPNGDRILILEDTNQDGKADTKKVFYEGNDINGALGIAVLGDRVIVSASPNVLVFYDLDHDDMADQKDTLFSSIKGIDDDHGMHAFIFGPDGRLYFNFGNAGTQIRDKNGAPIIDKFGRVIEAHGKPYRQGMAFRCNLDGSDLEVLGYNFRNIFELCIDSYGNIFQSDNDDDGNKGVRINHIMEYGNYGYQDQITGAGWRARRVGMHPEVPQRHWHVNDPGVIPNMLMTGAGSPAGITFYEGSMLPEIFRNQPIHAEPGHQVVRAYITEKNGAGYNASIKNILESKDKWFRPSDVCIAPDGSLFVADWHDAVVGGNGMDDRARGRIYRISPSQQSSSYQVSPSDPQTLDEAVHALMSPNQATRFLGWTKLHEAGMAAEPALLKLFERSDPIATIRSLWILAQLPQKGRSYVESMCIKGNEDQRIAALRMMRFLYPDQLLDQIQLMTKDPSPMVRKELAIALTGNCNVQAVDIWLELAEQYTTGDRWTLEALGLPSDHCPDLYFNAWLEKNQQQWNTPEGLDIVWRVRSEQALPYLAEIAQNQNLPAIQLARYIRAMHFIDSPDKDKVLVDILEAHPTDTTILKYVILAIDPGYLKESRKALDIILKDLDQISGSPEWFLLIKNLGLKNKNEALWSMILEDNTEDEKRKEAATTLVNVAGMSFIKSHIRSLVPEKYQEVITLFGNNANSDLASFLLTEISRKDLDFAAKRRIVDALGNSGNGQQALYTEIIENRIPDELKLAVAVKLLNSWNSTIRNEAPAILASIPGANFGKEPDIFTLSRKSGSAEKGEKVFQAYCANCHQIEGNGIRFGPDLSEIGNKLSNRGLYQAIIYPSAGVSFGYEGVNVTLKNGDKYQGYIESKTDEAIQIRIQSGQSVSVKNTDIATREDLHQSLMTEGLFRTFSQDELVDLVTYLQTLRGSDPQI